MPDPVPQAGVSRGWQTVSTLLNLRPGDGWPLLILLAHSCLKGAARVLLETPANTLFLSRFSIERLPLVYIATAVVCTVIGLIFARLEARVSVKTLLTMTLGFLSVVTMAFYLGLSATESHAVVFGVMVWKDVHWTLMSLEFWALAGLLLDVRQGKRLFGMIALGEIVAGMLGGFSIPLFIDAVGPRGPMLVLLASAVITIANVFLLMQTLRRVADLPPAHEEQPDDRKPLLTLFKDHYLALFFGVSALSLFGEFFIDYLFYANVESAFTDEAKLASFFGLFYGVLGIGQLISSAWISGRCLTRYGLSFGLLALPLAALVTTGTASIGEMAQAAAVVLFWTIVTAKFFDQVIRYTIETPAYRILYQPLPPHERLRVQAIRETIVEPVSLGCVGLFLWGMESLFAVPPRDILYLTVLVAMAWFALCIVLRREYTIRLTRALTARRLGEGSMSLDDQSSISILEQGFQSPKAGQVIYCLDMIEESRHPSLEAHLLKLLDHPDPLVRAHVLAKIEHRAPRNAGPPIAERLAIEPSPVVRAAILRTLCAIGEGDVVEQVLPYLNDPERAVRRGALVGLLRHCGIDGVLAGGSHLSNLLASAAASERQLAAEVLGDIGIAHFHRPLLALLRDEDTEVRLAAMEAASRLRAVSAIPALLEALDVRALRVTAAAALVELGEPALKQLEQAFGEEARSNGSRRAIAQIAGRIGGERAIGILTRAMAHPDGGIRTAILAALVHCREKSAAPEIVQARPLIAREAEEAAWALAAWADLEGDAAMAELSRALLGELDERKQRIFLLLALLYPPAVIRKTRLDLETGTAEKKAHSLEVLDNLLSQDLKRLTFPLIDLHSPQERGKQLQALFPQPRLSGAARLREMLQDSVGKTGVWTKACALYIAGRTDAAEWSSLAADRFVDRDPLIRETARWTLSRVDAIAFREQVALTGVDSKVDATQRRL